ncbi:helix-turn-helix domain-containing protein [Cytophagaceae bacterium DM2B3-1]|uniref:Helix-turn-helix domain-containing protein n=1 Tax=Xanthocytophaga flava TaxID=3048013 RepID=A0ABT7CL04_9BACT|nr:helix-turn-helix domain-containing protein [Xanthocytophaga flavus]MDJ1494423.1 helix-turn-helix domain-containing protein [Xanthocytophaga flavus]
MNVTIDFWAIVNLLGVIQGLLLSVVFFATNQGNKRANRLLGLLVLTGVFTTFEIFASYTGLVAYFPAAINTTEFLDFVMGPLIYWYTLALIKPDFTWKGQWVHLIPAVVFLTLRMPYMLQSSEFKLQDVNEVYHRIPFNPIHCKPILWFPKYHFGGFWMDLMVSPSKLLYQGWALYMIYRFARERNESFWTISNLYLKRFSRLIIFIGVVHIIVGVISLISVDDLGDIYIADIASLSYYFISFWVIQDSRMFAAQSLIHEGEKRKYEKSSLDDKETPVLVQKLLSFMASERPYLNGDLTLNELADKLKLSTHHLSQLVNEQIGKNFSDFINEYRVEELKKRLQDPASMHIKIEELAFESGFNSKSVFNTAFKKMTGLTPSQFRKSTSPINDTSEKVA